MATLAAGTGLTLRPASVAGPATLAETVVCGFLLLPALGTGDVVAALLVGGAGAAFLLSRTTRHRRALVTAGAAGLALAAAWVALVGFGRGAGGVAFLLAWCGSGSLLAAVVWLAEPAGPPGQPGRAAPRAARTEGPGIP